MVGMVEPSGDCTRCAWGSAGPPTLTPSVAPKESRPEYRLDLGPTRPDSYSMRSFTRILDLALTPSGTPDGPVAIDLFAGAGGLTLGMKAAGVRTIVAVEVEPYRTVTFTRHTPGATVLAADIRTIDFKGYRDRVELVYGGPPCQPFSSGGLRRAEKDARDMIPEFLRAVNEVRPQAVLMENVPGLVSGDRLKYLSEVIERLEDGGYNVIWKVLNAADYGVPQKRRRLFVVGVRNRTFHFPDETHGPGAPYPHVAVRAALPSEQVGASNPSRVFFARNPDLRPSPYDGHLFNGGGRPIDPSRPCHTILASAGGNKTHFLDPLGRVPEYHRHLCEGGRPRAGELSGVRRLTVEESAIIQTFPSWVHFAGPRSAQYHQVGDAVPPLLAAVMGRALVSTLRQTPTRVRRTRTKSLFG